MPKDPPSSSDSEKDLRIERILSRVKILGVVWTGSQRRGWINHPEVVKVGQTEEGGTRTKERTLPERRGFCSSTAAEGIYRRLRGEEETMM